jgi:hypothetical protein
LYARAEEQIEKETKGKYYTAIMGDRNAHAPREVVTVGAYGLRNRSERGDKLLKFCKICKCTSLTLDSVIRDDVTVIRPGETG